MKISSERIDEMKEHPLTVSSVAAIVGAAVALVSTSFALDARYVKTSDLTTVQNQVRAMFYSQELRETQSKILFLEDRVDSHEAGQAEVRELKRLQAKLKQMENKDWPDMASSFVEK